MISLSENLVYYYAFLEFASIAKFFIYIKCFLQENFRKEQSCIFYNILIDLTFLSHDQYWALKKIPDETPFSAKMDKIVFFL